MSSTLAVFEGLDDTRKEGVWVTDGSAVGTSELVSGSRGCYEPAARIAACLSMRQAKAAMCSPASVLA